MPDKDQKPESKSFFSKEEPKPEQPKKEDPKSPSGYEGRRKNKVCNDGKDWKDFH
jgi:hypothetical protein|tara:strand:+ start:784 stop:948 length:165 start_codon:yes stop_codon:yes gene_type:complete